jgi:dATP pyrophosphohydrolase
MRQPNTVLVFLFRRAVDGVRHAVFRRSDDDAWQSVSGGVEDTETLAEAARRETTEETGLPAGSPLYQLDMVSGVEKSCFAAAANWPASLYIVRKHFFAMDVSAAAEALVLSAEHKEFGWFSYEEAYAALRYDDDKTALWELDQRIARRDLPMATG